MVRGIIIVMVAIIIGVSVTYELATGLDRNLTTTSNAAAQPPFATGTDALLLGFIPTLIMVGVVMAVIALFA